MQKAQKKTSDSLLQQEEGMTSTDQALAETSHYQREEAEQPELAKKKKNRDDREFRYTFGWNEEENYSQYIVFIIPNLRLINNFIDGVQYLFDE